MKKAFNFILTDFFYILPIIKQYKLLENDLRLWGIIYEISIIILIIWAYNSKWNPFQDMIPYDIPQKIFQLWNMWIQIYFISIFIYALWYVFADSVPWAIWWMVTVVFVIYLSFQIGYGIWHIAKMKSTN